MEVLVLTIAHFLYHGKKVRLHTLLFDEAFYGIDAGRRDQILGFATDLGLQLFVASPDQDGVRREISYSSTILIKLSIPKVTTILTRNFNRKGKKSWAACKSKANGTWRCAARQCKS